MLEKVLPPALLETVSSKALNTSGSEQSAALHQETNPGNNGEAIVDSPLDPSEITSKSHIVVRTQEVKPSISKTLLDKALIKSSPYSDPLNFLDLRNLDMPTRLFALALTTLEQIRPDYATSEYMSTFNWAAVFESLRELCDEADIHWKRQDFYVVIFRSKLRKEADRVRLGELDQKSHQEACASGGLLTYWFGSPNDEMRNLATCIWRNREDAAAGGKGPWHRRARGAAREMYEEITFHTHKLIVENGALSWSLEEYHD